VLGEGFSVLFVCHANICRSPMAERLARLALSRIGGAADVSTSSAGTHAYPGDPMSRHAARVLREWGADDTRFASRRVDASTVAGADLVLTATRDQRRHCVELAPAAVRRTFTLRQFGRLVSMVDPAGLPTTPSAASRLRALVAETVTVRSRVPSVPAHTDDLADPVNQPVDAFRTCAGEIWAVLDIITRSSVRHPAVPDAT
jgi:protein-tyrosine phosphatase